jgi:7,8-dihydroneopterin aldolase/epimerase/oxygenase
MFTIHLTNLKFFAWHGAHEEERILGGEYEMDVEVTFKEKQRITALTDTVDYTKIYTVIKQRMQIPTALLETVVQELAQNIYSTDTRITSVLISLKKINPPIIAFTGNVGVSYKKDF